MVDSLKSSVENMNDKIFSNRDSLIKTKSRSLTGSIHFSRVVDITVLVR